MILPTQITEILHILISEIKLKKKTNEMNENTSNDDDVNVVFIYVNTSGILFQINQCEQL